MSSPYTQWTPTLKPGISYYVREVRLTLPSCISELITCNVNIRDVPVLHAIPETFCNSFHLCQQFVGQAYVKCFTNNFLDKPFAPRQISYDMDKYHWFKVGFAFAIFLHIWCGNLFDLPPYTLNRKSRRGDRHNISALVGLQLWSVCTVLLVPIRFWMQLITVEMAVAVAPAWKTTMP